MARPWLRFHTPLIGRVEDWRAGLGRSSCSLLARSFVCECHTISPRVSSPPPRRTLRADFLALRSPLASPQGLWDLSCRNDFRGDAPSVASAPSSPNFVLGAQPPAQPHRCVSVQRPVRFADGSYREVVRPSAQRAVHFAHQRRGLLPCSRSVGQRVNFLDRALNAFLRRPAANAPCPTLRRRPRGRPRTAWGRCGSLILHRSGLSPPTPCRSPGALTRVAARSLAPSPICDQLHRRLQPFRHLHDCSGCFRLERSPGGACTHWKAPPSHGAHVKHPLRIAPWTPQLGGLRAYKGRLGKDRSPRHSRRPLRARKVFTVIAEVPVRLLSGCPTIGDDRYGCYAGAPIVLV